MTQFSISKSHQIERAKSAPRESSYRMSDAAPLYALIILVGIGMGSLALLAAFIAVLRAVIGLL